MERRHRGLALRSLAEHEEAGGDLLAVIGEVLATHHRTLDREPAIVADLVPREPLEGGRGFGMIHGDRVPAAIDRNRGAAVGGRDPGRDLRDPTFEEVLHVGRKTSSGAGDPGGSGDHVEGGSGLEHGDAHHRGIEGIAVSRNHGLQGGGDRRRGDHRIPSTLRPRGVGSLSPDIDLETIARGEQWSGPGSDVAGGGVGPTVKSVDPLDRGRCDSPVENAVRDHPGGASSAFLRGLKKHHHRARQWLLRGEGREMAGGSQQDGGVAVMSAGVHASGDRGCPGGAGLFDDREGVDVGSQSDGFPTELVTAGEPGEDAGTAGESGSMFDARVLQFPGNDLAGSSFFVGDFRVGVKIASDVGDVLDQGLRYRHRITSGAGEGRRIPGLC